MALTWGDITVDAKKTIKNIDSGVKGFGINRPPYSLEWFVFWMYVALGVFICYEIFIKRRHRFYKLFNPEFNLPVNAPTNSGNDSVTMNTNFS